MARNAVSYRVQQDIAGTDIGDAKFEAEKQKSGLPFYLIDP